jgi:hypothetical protein
MLKILFKIQKECLVSIPFSNFRMSSERDQLKTSGFSSSDGHDDDASYACESQSSYAFFSFRKACAYLQKG